MYVPLWDLISPPRFMQYISNTLHDSLSSQPPQLLSCSRAKVPKLVIQKLTGVPFLSLIYSSRFRVRSGVVTVHRTFSKVAMHINSFTAIGASQSFGLTNQLQRCDGLELIRVNVAVEICFAHAVHDRFRDCWLFLSCRQVETNI